MDAELQKYLELMEGRILRAISLLRGDLELSQRISDLDNRVAKLEHKQ